MTRHLSAVASQPELGECVVCFLEPCACTYIDALEPGGRLHHLFAPAAAEVAKPIPHRGGCPCPRCLSHRTATYRCPACTGDDRGLVPCGTHRPTAG